MEDSLQNIEIMRELLHKMAMVKGLSHPNVMAVSKILDQEICAYLRDKVKDELSDGGHIKCQSENL